MSGDLDQAGFAPAGPAPAGSAAAGSTEHLTARTKWIALAAFAAVTAVGVLPLTPGAPAAATAALIAVGAAGLLVQRRRPPLLYAAVATGGIAVLAGGLSNNVGWIAVCLIAAWCVLTGSRAEGLAYWAGR